MRPGGLKHRYSVVACLARMAIALGLFPWHPALAQHKCVTPEGRVTYSERPCVSGSKAGAMSRGTLSGAQTGHSAAAAYSPPAQVRLNYYDVEGNDFSSLLGALNARGTFHGRADWRLSYRFQSRMGPGGCGVSSIGTDLDLQMTLPRWAPPAGVAGDLVSRWERYVAALRLHEEGHLDHGRGAEKEFKVLASAMTAPDCGSLDRALRDRFSKLIADYQARDRDYDKRTEHGRTQGAWFR